MDVRRTLDTYAQEYFPQYFLHFLNFHEMMEAQSKGHQGHGLDHDLLVAQYCLLIAPNSHAGLKAWVAALVHSYDRFYGDEAMLKINEALAKFRGNWLDAGDFDEIRLAVARHDKPNANDDSETQIVLQDADRLANAGPIVLVRSGQFNPGIPSIELGHVGLERHPESTYMTPRSCKDDLIGCLEWESNPKFGLRLPKARKIGRKYFLFLKQWFELVELQFEETGLADWTPESVKAKAA